MRTEDVYGKIMAKFANPSKLSKEEQEKLLIQLCQAIAKLNNPAEAAQFLKDLLSSQEAEMLAKRLKTAELLIAGKTYAEICFALKMASNTVAKIHEWLKLSGEGYRLVLERIPKDAPVKNNLEERFDYLSWRNVKRRYPLYFWPQLLLENIIKMAKENDKRKLRVILKKMDKKTALYKRLDKLFNKYSSAKRARRSNQRQSGSG